MGWFRETFFSSRGFGFSGSFPPTQKIKFEEMKKSVSIVVILVGLMYGQGSFGQQLPMYGQYIFNSSILNPAQAGSGGCHQVGLLGRHQWIGIEGAPRTYSAYGNFTLGRNLGLAGGIYQDNVGRIKELNVQGDVSYHVRLRRDLRLGVGLRAQVSNFGVDLTDFEFSDPTDPWYGKDFGGKVLFNVGVGALLHGSRGFFGVSVPKVLRNRFTDNVTVGDFARDFHLFVYGGGTLGLSDVVSLTPSFLFKHSDSAPLQFDFNGVFGYSEVLDFGLLVRTDFHRGLDAIGLLLGLNLGSGLHAGYKYEYPMNDLNMVTMQVHELSLSYRWCSGRGRFTASPRYFL